MKMRYNLLILLLLGSILTCSSAIAVQHSEDSAKLKLFDMRAILDPSTLEPEVIQDWRLVPGPVETRQKIVTINVGQIWPGQMYRIPVRMTVPANHRAIGFHLTGANNFRSIRNHKRLNQTDQPLIQRNIGLVDTVIQDLRSIGMKK